MIRPLTLFFFLSSCQISAQSLEQNKHYNFLKDALRQSNLVQPDFAKVNQLFSKCTSDANEVRALAITYFTNDFYRGMSTSSDHIREKLRVMGQSGNPCFEAAATAYVVAALERLQGDLASDLALTTNLLFLAGKLKFLTPDLRREKGGMWQTIDSENNFKIQGAYDCEDSTVFLDFEESAYDLAGLMVHEADHLFRDKFLQKSDHKLAPQSLALLDETLAVVSAGYFQVVNSLVYRPPFDLSLFKPYGFLEHLGGAFQSVTVFVDGEGNMPIRNPLRIVQKAFLRPMPDVSWGGKRRINKNRRGIYNLVAQGYFGKNMSISQSRELAPGNLKLELDPMILFLNENALLDDLDRPREEKLDHLWKLLFEKSENCVAFEEDFDSGKLGSYLEGLSSNSSPRQARAIRACLDYRNKL